ncbi:methyl-accepting chemotaxis protein [Thiomicrorhabdus aquaedulcis]|uniref:methyl-accepting chemotaxis protein n=1 Tax=Thiomicrorhabdus aquaedulcis TaxID=2211106 RepID=UPI000FD8DE71|nr:methyl-accepting chemotaxis protein [Thiomicrorhabdus aquaedulcis]
MNQKSLDLQAIDKKVLIILLAHIPFVAFLAPIGYDTHGFAMLASGLIGALAIIGYATLKGTRGFGILSGVLVLLFSATLIQTQMGRIEMHFHIFVGLAFLLIYKDWLVVLVAALVGAVHHLAVTQMQLSGLDIAGMPIMLFNYDCSWSITFLHALFVVIEAAVLMYYALLMKKEQLIAQSTMNTINDISRTSDFSKRVNQFQDSPNVQAVNQLMASVDSAIKQIVMVMQAISKGEFTARVTEQYEGDLNQLKQAVNASAQSVTHTMHSLEDIMNGLSQGHLATRMSGEVQGGLKQKVDLAMSQTEHLVSEMVAVMSAVSKGDFSQRVQTQAAGQFGALKQNVNQALDDLQQSFTEINQASKRLAQGKLNQPITQEYQGELNTLKEGLNFAFTSLSGLVTNVVSMNQQLNVAVDEIYTGSEGLSHALEDQAQQLQSTASAFGNIAAGVKQSSEGALKANQLSSTARVQAESGVKVMENTILSMRTIQESSQKISEIVALIDSIAFQTNLLALNAAVEAARAGEQGRGFAVVAGEVRALAGKSANAAKDIRELIDRTVTAIDSGTQLVETSGESLSKINLAIKDVSEIIADIANLSQTSARDMEQVNQLIRNIDALTQHNASLATQSSSTAQSVVANVQSLTLDLNKFEINAPSSRANSFKALENR